MFLWAIVRRLLALFIRLLLLNKIVTLGVLGLLVVGLIGAPFITSLRSDSQSANLAGPTSPNLPVARAAASHLDAEAPSVQLYMKGPALSPQMLAKMDPVEKYQAQMDDVKQRGAQYDEIAYIGSYPRKDGAEYYFYVVTMKVPVDTFPYRYTYYVFTVGPDGKIADIQ
jgi:hypothetical protein